MNSAAHHRRPLRAATCAAVVAVATLTHMPLRWLALGEAEVAAQGRGGPESTRITLPPSVTFYVTNVSASTQAVSPSVVTFSNAQLRPGRGLQISVRAETRRFQSPFQPAIDVSAVSWRTTNVLNGVGVNGTLARTYQDVYASVANAQNGGVTITWTLAPLPPGIDSGAQTVTLDWRLRSAIP